MVRSNGVRAIAVLLAALPATGQAQTVPLPASASAVSAAEIEALIAKAKATIKPEQANLVQPLLQFAPYRASLEYRQASANAAVHRDDAEIFYVLKGGGNLVEGGALSDPAPGDGRNVSARTIVGGASRHVAAGDVFVVAKGIPHQFDKVDGVLVMITMKLPMPGEAPSGAR